MVERAATNRTSQGREKTGMRKLRALLAALSLTIAGLSHVFAQGAAPQPSPEALQAAKELVALMSPGNIGQLSENVTRMMWPGIVTTLRSQHPNLDAATLAELRQKFAAIMSETVAQVKAEMPTIYARYFTVAEMRQIVAFYRTPAGAKTLTLMPKIMSDREIFSTARSQAAKAEIGPAFAAILRKHGYGPK
jgi:uncharacterized protein